jgi:hypothetical protein
MALCAYVGGELMAIENDKEIADNGAEDGESHLESERPERAERVDDKYHRLNDKGRRQTLRSSLKDAFADEKAAAKEGNGKAAPQAADKTPDSSKDRGTKAASPDKPIPATPKPGETAAVTTEQQVEKVAAPAALSKEVKAIWETLPPAVQSEFARREADTQKGVDQLKAKYKPIEDAFAPVQNQLRQLGKTEAEAASQLIGWQAALANPRTQAQAFRALAQAHNFDLSTLAPNASQAGAAAVPNPNPDPTQAFRPLLDPLMQKISTFENEFQRRDQERVQSDITNMAKDKPHFEKVRFAMGHLITAGLVTGASPQEVFDEAYARACRADPEVFAAIQQEAETKREAELKAAQEADAKKKAEDAEAARKKQADDVAKARKAGFSRRSGTPSGMAISASNKGKSVGDSLREAANAVRGGRI